MDKADAAQLLGYCAAFDNRTVGRVDATAWAAALRDVPCDGDALDAVARYYGTAPERPGERLWIQPHHVRAGRLAIRKERLGDTLPAYVPLPARRPVPSPQCGDARRSTPWLPGAPWVSRSAG